MGICKGLAGDLYSNKCCTLFKMLFLPNIPINSWQHQADDEIQLVR